MRNTSAVRAVLPLRSIAARRRDHRDARQAEIGPEQAGRHDAIMRRDDQAVELIIGVAGEREHHPVLAAFAGAHFDTADNAVSARRGRHLDAVAIAALVLKDGGEVNGRRIAPDADRVDRISRRTGRSYREAQRQ
ncbi:MAG: hypothetical protein MZV49_16335 [Rhodopseudomonas palustris]|nr:hypothetical protein [Rhodopseudomonas palustris]